MTVVQRWLAGLTALGALFLVFSKPEGFFKAATGLKELTAGSIVAVTTGKN